MGYDVGVLSPERARLGKGWAEGDPLKPFKATSLLILTGNQDDGKQLWRPSHAPHAAQSSYLFLPAALWVGMACYAHFTDEETKTWKLIQGYSPVATAGLEPWLSSSLNAVWRCYHVRPHSWPTFHAALSHTWNVAVQKGFIYRVHHGGLRCRVRHDSLSILAGHSILGCRHWDQVDCRESKVGQEMCDHGGHMPARRPQRAAGFSPEFTSLLELGWTSMHQ